MVKVQHAQETDIIEFVDMAREDAVDNKVIPWIIERSPKWKSAGYSEIVKAIKEAGIELQQGA